MASFTGVGDNTTLTLTHPGEAVTVAISGTYNMTIALQREQGSPGSGAWGDIKRYTEANATVSEAYTTVEAGERVRLIVLVDTSGTATATLTNASDEVFSSLTIRDPLGTVKAQFDQGGLLLPEDLDVTGDVAVTGTLAVTGASTLTGLVTHAEDVVFSNANPEIRGGDTDGALFVSPETTSALGGNIVLYGAAHGTKAGDIEFRNTATLKLSYDLSATKWVFADDLHFSVANPELLGADADGALLVGPSTTSALGGNAIFYGESHSTKAGDIEFRNTATIKLGYDLSATTWTFGDKVVLQTATNGLVLGAGASGSNHALGSTAGNAVELYLDATHTTGDMRGMYLRLYFSGAGGSGEAARVFGTINNVSVATGGTVNGAHISLGTAGASAAVSGAANALRTTFGIAAASTNIGGTCSVIQVDTDIAAGVTLPTNFAFLRFTNTGAGTDIPKALFRLPNVAAATNGLFCAHVTDTMTHSIRIVSEDGTEYHLMATTTVTNRTES